MSRFEPGAGQRALVTGAGSGIGRWLCRHFAAKGMAVIAVDIDEAAARETVTGMEDAHAFACDVSDRAALMALAQRCEAQALAPNLLWINAGVGSADTIVGASERTIAWLYGVNVMGPIWTAQAFVPLMRAAKEAGGGPFHVGVTASSASVTPVAGPFTLYATTKQATASVAEALAAELEPDGIGVTILCPGILDTDIWNAKRARPERFGGARVAPEEAGAHWRAQPGPEVLAEPLDEALARGGGWCIAATEDATRGLMEERQEAQRKGLREIRPDS